MDGFFSKLFKDKFAKAAFIILAVLLHRIQIHIQIEKCLMRLRLRYIR